MPGNFVCVCVCVCVCVLQGFWLRALHLLDKSFTTLATIPALDIKLVINKIYLF
jgi:hypothetical protein